MSNFETVKVNVKTHVQKHKKAYAIGVGVGVLAVGGYILESRGFSTPLLSYKSELTTSTTIQVRGHLGHLLYDLNTGGFYVSQNEAARVLDVDPKRIAEHLAGKLPNVKGHTLIKLVDAA